MAAGGKVSLFIESLIAPVLAAGAGWVIGYFMAAGSSGGRSGDGTAGALAGAVLGALLVLVPRWLRAAWRGRARHAAPGEFGTIVAISKEPPPGAPWYHWLYVLVDVQGRRLKLKVPAGQAKAFSERFAVGDVGRIVVSGKELVQFAPASETAPVRPKTGIKVFVSYAHGHDREGQMAEYLAQVFRTAGLEPWVDTSAVKPGQKLREELARRIREADYFVPLLSPDYMASPWCLKEFETAAEAGIPMRPVKIAEGRLVPPPALKTLYDEKAGEPVYLDMNSRDAPARLREMADAMAG